MKIIFFILLSIVFIWAQDLEEIRKGLKGDRKTQETAYENLLKIDSLQANELHASHFAGANPYHRDKSYKYLLSVSDSSYGKWLATLPLQEKDPYARKLFLDLLAERALEGKKDDGVEETFLKLISLEKQPLPLGSALLGAGKIQIKTASDAIHKKLDFKHPRVRAYGYEALARLEGKNALETLKKSLEEKDYETQVYSIQMIGEFARNFGPRGYTIESDTPESLGDPDSLKCPTCGAPVKLTTSRSGNEFYGCTKFRSDNCRGRIDFPNSKNKKEKADLPIDEELRKFAIDSALQVFKNSDKDSSQGWRLKAAAMKVLATYPDSRSIELLFEYLKSKPEGKMPSLAARTLYEITNKDLGDEAKVWESWWKVNKDKWTPTTWGYKINDPQSKGKSTATYYGIEIVSDRIAFVLDGSGSMSGPVTVTRKSKGGSVVGPASQTMSFLERAKQELFRCVRELAQNNAKAKVQVIFFQEKLLTFSPKKMANARASLKPIEAFFKKVTAEQSGDMLLAVQTAMEDSEVDTIFILSDGAPSAGLHTIKASFLKWIEEENRFRSIQFFGIIIGNSIRGKSIMQDLAETHQGKAIEDDLVLRE